MPSNDPQNIEKHKISLRSISRQFLGALQQQHDILAYALAASRAVNEEQFDSLARMAHAAPEPSRRLTFERAKEMADRQILHAAFGDALLTFSACMDECFTLSILATMTAAERNDPRACAEKLDRARSEFMRLPPVEKLTSLTQFFDLGKEATADMRAFIAATTSIVQGQGIVTPEMVGADGTFTLILHGARKPADGTTEAAARAAAITHNFSAGEPIRLDKPEVLLVPITCASFLVILFRSMQEFGRQMERLEG